jgi:hypothetical protein
MGWGRLSPRQRIAAAILTVLLSVAATYRLVVFGDVNRIYDNHPTVTSVTGEGEYIRPTIAEVDQSARSNARADGKIRHLSCHEATDGSWSCSLQLLGGATVVYRGVWDPAHGTVAWSAAEWKAALHFTVPLQR